jgi:nicotinate phosphoribosyltransferase
VFRVEENGRAVRDVLARAEEKDQEGRPLLHRVMAEGRPVSRSRNLDEIRDYARSEIAKLPEHVQALEPADPSYLVEVSDALKRYQREVAEALGG